MSADKSPHQEKSILVEHVFNSPVLVPWTVVEKLQNDPDEAREAILLWQEAKRDGYRFKENNEVVEQNNPTLKMTIGRILRQNTNENGEIKKRLIGMSCYWWVSLEEASIQIPRMNMHGRRVPAAQLAEQEEEISIT